MPKAPVEFAAAKTLAVVSTSGSDGLAVRAVMSAKGVKSVTLQHVFVPSVERTAEYASKAGFLAADGFDAKWVPGRHSFLTAENAAAVAAAVTDAVAALSTFTAPVAGAATVKALAPEQLLAAMSDEQMAAIAAILAAAKNAKK